jgi:hypothetical protein
VRFGTVHVSARDTPGIAVPRKSFCERAAVVFAQVKALRRDRAGAPAAPGRLTDPRDAGTVEGAQPV